MKLTILILSSVISLSLAISAAAQTGKEDQTSATPGSTPGADAKSKQEPNFIAPVNEDERRPKEIENEMEQVKKRNRALRERRMGALASASPSAAVTPSATASPSATAIATPSVTPAPKP